MGSKPVRRCRCAHLSSLTATMVQKTFAEETNAPRGAAWMDEKSEEEEGSEQQRAGCYQKAWIYPELPW